MLKKIIGTFFGSRNDRLLKEYAAKVAKINALEPKIKKLKDNDFPKKTIELKNRFNQGEALDTLHFMMEKYLKCEPVKEKH